MNRIDRLMGIITLLQTRKHCTTQQIAGHFGISERTVFRDLKALNELHVPIGFEPDKGYFIVGGYFLPPITLTAEEANALALTEPLVIRFADKHVARHVGTALSKIKMALSGPQRDKLEKIQSQTAHYVPDEYAHLLPDTNYLSIIQGAIIHRNILKIAYRNAQEEISEREVEPIGLTFYSLNWHLIGWCHLRQEYRDFRTSRIVSLQSTLKPFGKTDHIELNEYLRQIQLLTPEYP
jgi:predicted DNA-binding transcriptional regulator YafY